MTITTRLSLLKGALTPRQIPNAVAAWAQVVLGGVKTLSVSDTGITVKIANPLQNRSAVTVLETELPMIESYISAINSTTQVWDVGAEVGVYTCLAGKLGAANVVSFEPRPQIAEKLRVNMIYNDVPGGIELAALGEHRAELTDWLRKNAPGAAMTDADSYVEDHGSPDVVKVDIEGGELGFLREFKRTLSEDPPRLLLIEIHPEGEHSQGEIRLSDKMMTELRDRLDDANYHVEEIANRDGQLFLKAEQEMIMPDFPQLHSDLNE